jgi:GxxExxY protein
MDTAALDRTSYLIIQSAIEIHKVLGPGLLESAYRTCMIHELGLRNLKVSSKLMVPVRYKKLLLDGDYRLDLIVEDAVVVELKTVETVLPVHRRKYFPICGSRVRA